MYPETEFAERIVREMWLYVMEKEAISAYLQLPENRWLHGVIPEIHDVDEAVYVGTMDLLGQATDEDVEAAKAFLTLMEQGLMKPKL
jgi:hypothetical protein